MAKQELPQKGTARRKKEQEKKSVKEQTIEFFKSIGFALVAVIILNSFLLASFQVPTGSMENTVMAGDLLFVNKFIFGGCTPPTIPILGILTGVEVEIPYFRIPGFRDPRKGDVIVFIWPGNRDDLKAKPFQYYLKRCVGTAGDTVQVLNKKLYVNGKPFEYHAGIHFEDGDIIRPAGIAEYGIFPANKPWNRDNYGPLVIPKKGRVIQLDQNNYTEWETFIRREGHEVDLRDSTVLIDGKPSANYTVKRDYCFGMGDNRDNSLDSRYWGFIPKENIVGTPMIVYWSWDPNVSIGNLIRKIGSVRFSRIGTIIR
jgi:signal peptidase I